MPREFAEVASITSPDGILVAKITTTDGPNGQRWFSFAVLRTIAKDDGTAQTHWLHARHIDTMRKLLNDVEERLHVEEEMERLRRARKIDENHRAL